jgi:glycosyltransferase involved in cell wall biosynthesis
MKILFLTLVKTKSLSDRGIYTDLLRKFKHEGHEIFVVNPVERREKKNTFCIYEENTTILNVKTLNIQKTNLIEKGLGTLLIEYQYLKAIKKYFDNEKFDLILYSTPPITFSKVISYIKNRDNAFSYLLLKDIFPQNAIDMKMMKENGILHKLFVKKERKLYELSDAIGCMSEANKQYVIKYNPYLNPNTIEVNPNTIEPISKHISDDEKENIKLKYQLPLDKKIFVYGGNLGKPQGLDFLIQTIENCKNSMVFFLIVGSGTEFPKIEKWFLENKPTNAKLLSSLPKYDYDVLLQSCDIGLIFLHPHFTIPNFPSRLLSYLEMKIPVIAATDSITDIGKVIQENGCGFSVQSGDVKNMIKSIDRIIVDEEKFLAMKENAWKLLNAKYDVSVSYNLIIKRMNNV